MTLVNPSLGIEKPGAQTLASITTDSISGALSEMRRRAAVEPVIGHLKDDHRMRCNYLKGRDGDRINAVLAAAGYNFSLLLRWFEELLRALLLILASALLAPRFA
jgi:IS5 family transposase